MSISDILMILFAFGSFLIALLTLIIDLIDKMTKKITVHKLWQAERLKK